MKEIEIVNYLRVLSNYTITNANSGHPGVCLSAAPIFYSIFKNLKVDTKNPKYFNRDFFVASAGHASSLLYSTMHMFNYNITMEDLKNFRKLNSKTPGHPEIETLGVDSSTGPLGQGVANAVGISLGINHLKALFNKPKFEIFNNFVYCFLGDGCLMEGISNEAFSLAGTLKLNNLIFIYDHNQKTIEGKTNITFNEDIVKKFKAYHFNVFVVKNGNSLFRIENAIKKAKKSKTKPSIIIVDTLIGYGSHLQDSELSHGKPFSLKDIETLKNNLKVKCNPFVENQKYFDFCKNIDKAKQKTIEKENANLDEYKKQYPKEYELLTKFYEQDYATEIVDKLEHFDCSDNLSTREINHKVLNFVASYVLNLIGGTGDVASSTQTFIDDEKYINEGFRFRNIHFGVREHAMGAISNGLALTGGLLPFCSCYLSFSDYMKHAIRMSALMNLPVFYQFSHDDLFVGEDGPTHQPVEQLVGLRAIPNLMVFRPYNLTEILACYHYYFSNLKPTAIILSKTKTQNTKTDFKLALKGGYIIKKEKEKLAGVLIATGSQVELALKVGKLYENLRVVSLPNIELFFSQDQKYINSVLGTKTKKIVLEALSPYSFYKLAGENTLLLTNNSFGKSGSPKDVGKAFGFDEKTIEKKIKEFLNL